MCSRGCLKRLEAANILTADPQIEDFSTRFELSVLSVMGRAKGWTKKLWRR